MGLKSDDRIYSLQPPTETGDMEWKRKELKWNGFSSSSSALARTSKPFPEFGTTGMTLTKSTTMSRRSYGFGNRDPIEIEEDIPVGASPGQSYFESYLIFGQPNYITY
ncbi:hypothetical protein L596_005077 [Steinernema carpocapsae]|uniref:Uncharacterized protein n=1 Tax=Steinernema carpocapsae TaxID=34508 RepID=A0A4U8V225_STECR|nr:hypothetical protein L596_005077 [Steinernema carpocapsae]